MRDRQTERFMTANCGIAALTDALAASLRCGKYRNIQDWEGVFGVGNEVRFVSDRFC